MEERARLLSEIQTQYAKCQVIDLERAILLIPPRNGCFGKLPLELPVQVPIAFDPNCNERDFSRVVTTQMSGLTRALPDMRKRTLGALHVQQLLRETAWTTDCMEVFLRFGILTTAPSVLGRGFGRQMMKILPPQYADDMQVILRIKSKEDPKTLIDLLRQSDYDCQGWSSPRVRAHGYMYVFWTMKIEQDLVTIRDQMEDYWRLVTGSWRAEQEQRRYINSWLSGIDFR